MSPLVLFHPFGSPLSIAEAGPVTARVQIVICTNPAQSSGKEFAVYTTYVCIFEEGRYICTRDRD